MVARRCQISFSRNYNRLSAQQLDLLFEKADLPNLQGVDGAPPVITGDLSTDDRIRQIALERGYRRRSGVLDEQLLVMIEEPRYYLQPPAARAYLQLKAAARRAGCHIRATSAFRGFDHQRHLFLENLQPPYSSQDVEEVLRARAIPGYSKHHTGYVIDLAEGSLVLDSFVDSKSYIWLIADNYKNAREYGWLPSYPPGVENQGPDPEPWEFIYVGQGNL